MQAPATIRICNLIAIAMLTVATGCQPEFQQTPVPPTLIGKWTTADPRYAGRYLEITPTSVVLGVGEEVPRRYVLREITATSQPIRGTIYEITFIDREFDDYQIKFQIQREEGEVVMRLVNQFQIAWRKETD